MNDDTQRPVRQQQIDGRTARRHRNKTAVLDAVIELFAEGHLNPGVHLVAKRSGVSLRSVYRYFDDIADLVSAAIERHIDRSHELFQITDLGTGPTLDRIRRFCERRVALFVCVRAVYRATIVRAGDHSELADGLEESRANLRRQTAEMFAPELDALDVDRALVVSGILDTLAQFESLEHVHRANGEDEESTAEFLVAAFGEILL